ncbi:hypothetical protein Agub_g13872 [Astrephomene gubernaculifera]|uniref:Cyclic nucleotide-binding domain-containing protein n=1 Tax=Astrephomene gubernaculifera TaxID=47775 RepID=A0AAD3E0X7_9CHLO|nr:hypothetical protein Agub_g13872 [Astrephomene gubernaculifera]
MTLSQSGVVEGSLPLRQPGQLEPGSKDGSSQEAGMTEDSTEPSGQRSNSGATTQPTEAAADQHQQSHHAANPGPKHTSPRRRPAHHAAAPDDAEPDPNGTHTARAVTPGRQPLAVGPPAHSKVQKGRIIAAVTAAAAASAAAAVPLDWSYLLGHPAALSGPLGAAAAAVAAGTAAAAGTGGAKSKAGSTTAGTSSGADNTTSGAAGGQSSVRLSGGQSSLRQTSQSGSGAGSLLGGLSRRANAAASTLPATAEGKFCSAVMGVMERLAATQSAQTGRYRSLRMQAAEQREAMLSTVLMPPPPTAGAFSSREAAARMEAVLQRSGASRDNMQAIVQQIQQFRGLSDDLRTAVAQQFHLFSYPPGSYLYEQDCRCDEAFVLISGAAMLHVEGRPPQRLYPGTVLGVELMLRRQAVPLTVTTDPHFEAQLATLSWQAYEDTVRHWAAEKVTALLPELQASQAARLQAALMRGVSYSQRQPGEPIYVGGQAADHVALLVQGQVLVAAPLEDTDLVTTGQMVSQLKTLMGPLAGSMVLNEMPRMPAAPRGGLRGGLKGGMRSSDGGARRSMAGMPSSTTTPSPLSVMHGSMGVAAAAGASGHTVRMRGLMEMRGSGGEGEGRHGGAEDRVLRLRGAVVEHVEEQQPSEAGDGGDAKAGTAGGIRARILARRDSMAVAAANASSTSGEVKPGMAAVGVAAPPSSASGEAAGGDSSEGLGDGGEGSGTGSGQQQQQQRRPRVRSGGMSGRNSRHSNGLNGTTAAAAAEAANGGNGTMGMEPAAGTEGGLEGPEDDEDVSPFVPAVSAAAAASRSARRSLLFAADGDGGEGSEQATSEAGAAAMRLDQATGAAPEGATDEQQPVRESSDASGTKQDLGPSSSTTAVAASRPESAHSTGIAKAEASLLPATSITDLASDPSSAYSAYSARAGTGSGSEGFPEPHTPMLGFKMAGFGAVPPAVEPWRQSPRSGDTFAFSLGTDESKGSRHMESPATPVLFSLAGAAEDSESKLHHPFAPAIAAEHSSGLVSLAMSLDGSELPRVDDLATDAVSEVEGPAAVEPPAAAEAPPPLPLPAAAPVAAPTPSPMKGLRSKIGGDSVSSLPPPPPSGLHAVRHHHGSSGSRVSSRGASPLVSGASTPRSSSSVRLAAAVTGSEGLPPRHSPLRGGTSPASSENGAAVGRRGLSSNSGSSARTSQSAGGLPRRPSTPTSEAPSVDDRTADSRESAAQLLLHHPVLPPSPPSSPPLRPSSPSQASGTGTGDGATADDAANSQLELKPFSTSGSGAAADEGASSAVASADGGGVGYEADGAAAGAPPSIPSRSHTPDNRSADGAAESVGSEPSVEVVGTPPETPATPVRPADNTPGTPATPTNAVFSSAPFAAALTEPRPAAPRQPSRLRLSSGDHQVAPYHLSADTHGSNTAPAALPPSAPAAGGFPDKGQQPGMRLRMGPGAEGIDGRRSNTGRAGPNFGTPGATVGGGAGSALARRSELGPGGHYISPLGGGGGGGGGSGAAQPLANALAAQLKAHHHKVAAVYGGPVVFCEEALAPLPPADKKAVRVAAHSAIATQRCELILIPASLLRSLVPPPLLPKLEAAAVGAQRRLMQASGHVVDTAPVAWPAAADRIRMVLATPPGQRQPWQVELLAAAFSHLPAFARLTWQVRLKVFQELEYRRLDPGSQLDLAKLDVSEAGGAQPRPSQPPNTKGEGALGPEASSGSVGTEATRGGTVTGTGAGAPPAAESSKGTDPGVGSHASEQTAVGDAGAAAALAAYAEALAAEVGAMPERAHDGATVTGSSSGGSVPGSRAASMEGESLEGQEAAAPPEKSGEAATGDEDVTTPTDAIAVSAGVTDGSEKARQGTIVGDTEAAQPQAPPAATEETQPDGDSNGEALSKEAPQAEADRTAGSVRGSEGGASNAASTGECCGTEHGGALSVTTTAATADGSSTCSGSRTVTGAGESDAADVSRPPTHRKQSWAERFGSRSSRHRMPPAAQEAAAVTSPAAAAAAAGTAGTPDGSKVAATMAAAGTVEGTQPNSAGSRRDSAAQGKAASADAADTSGGGGKEGAQGSKRSSGSEPHTVEALFDPVAAEPLIPSLALRRNSTSVTDLDLAGAADSTASGTGDAEAAPPSRASSWTPYDVSGDAATVDSTAAGERSPEPGGHSFWEGDPPDSAAGFSMPPRLGTADTFLSEAPSHSLRSTGSLASGRYGSLREGDVLPHSSSPGAEEGELEEAAPAEAEAAAAAAEAAEAAVGVAAESSRMSSRPSEVGQEAPERLLPRKREAVAVKLDDRAYWCLSGAISLEIQLQPPPYPDAPPADSATQPATPTNQPASPHHRHAPPSPEHSDISGFTATTTSKASPSHSPSPPPHQQHQHPQPSSPSPSLPPPPPSPPSLQQLQLAHPGDAFSGGALADATTAAFSAAAAAAAAAAAQARPSSPTLSTDPRTVSFTSVAPSPGASAAAASGFTSDGASTMTAAAGSAAGSSPASEAHQHFLQGLPLGSNLIRARVVGEAPAEVLCMSKPMFELMASGVGRSVPPSALPVLARHVDWLIGVDLQAMANDLAGRYRLEEHKQGTELLRAGEAAPVVFLVAAGECLMRGPVVGLRDPASVADGLDLATLREGATCGELSLLAARPLWYTLVVSSPSAKVISIDLAALRTWLLTSPLGQAAAAEVVAAVAEVDIALYGRAVKQIAAMVMCGKLDLALFTPPMKSIIRRIMEDDAAEIAATLQHQKEHAEEKEKEKEREKERERKVRLGGGSGSGGGASGGASGGPMGLSALAGSTAVNRPRSIVMEGWSQVEAIAASVARPYDPEAQSWELIAQAQYVASRRQQQRYLDSLFSRSELATEEDPAGHASGGQRIAMPAPGLVAAALAEPTAVRNPRMYDIRIVPKDLRGRYVEAARLGWDTSFLPSHELSAMMDAEVHVKHAALGLLTQQQQQQEGQLGRSRQLQQQQQDQLQRLQSEQQRAMHTELSRSFPQSSSQQQRMLSGEISFSTALASTSSNASGGSTGGKAVLGASNCLLPRRAGAAAPAPAPEHNSTAHPRTTEHHHHHQHHHLHAAHGTASSPAAPVAARLNALDPHARLQGPSAPNSPSSSSSLVPGAAGTTPPKSARSRLHITTASSGMASVVSLSPEHGMEAPWDAQGRLRVGKPWDNPGADGHGGGGGGDGGDVVLMTPSRLRRELGAASGWSLAQLEDLRRKSAILLSGPPSSGSTAALDPEFQAQMDDLRNMYGSTAGSDGFSGFAVGGGGGGGLDEGGGGGGAAAAGVVASVGSPHAPHYRSGSSHQLEMVAGAGAGHKAGSSGTGSPSRLRAVSLATQPPVPSPLGCPPNSANSSNGSNPNSNPSSLRRGRNRAAGTGATPPSSGTPPMLSVIEEEDVHNLFWTSTHSPHSAPKPGPPAVAAVTGTPGSMAAAAGGGGGGVGSTLPLKPLPPLPPPHDQLRLMKHPPVATPPAAAPTPAWATAVAVPGTADVIAAAPPAAPAPATSASTTSATATTGKAATASVVDGPTPSQSAQGTIAARRSRIQARTAAPPAPEPVESPDRSFWVRDRLHDPQGLAQSVISDAAARAVSAAVTRPQEPPLTAATTTATLTATTSTISSVSPADASAGTAVTVPATPATAAAASARAGSASANVLMAAGGRTGIPTIGRTRKLQPLKRNGAGAAVRAPGDGGAASEGVAVAAGQAGGAGALLAGTTAAAAGNPAAALADADMLFVTLQLPPAPKLLPEFPSPAAAREAAEAAAAAEQAAREARLAAAVAHPSARPLFVRPDLKYVPQYLRQRQRSPVLPPPVRHQLEDAESDSWVVPSYSSEYGFKDGFYDENSQVIYFD